MENANIAAAIILAVLAICLTLLLTFAGIDKFGNDNEKKLKAFKLIIANVFICYALIIIATLKMINIILTDVFYLLLSAGMTSLGFKIGIDIKNSKNI
ncbi:MAG TPA: hypothetical protein VGF79_13595 [Bacteroidia bacterium]